MGNDNVDRDGFAPRAGKGGAIGANGEFYRGGQFIANSENTIKGSSMAWEPRPKSEWELARDAEIAASVALQEAWLAGRVARFADLLARLEAVQNTIPVYESFEQSMARQFRQAGSLSTRQAECVAKFEFGRRTKKNEEAFYALVEQLSTRRHACGISS